MQLVAFKFPIATSTILYIIFHGDSVATNHGTVVCAFSMKQLNRLSGKIIRDTGLFGIKFDQAITESFCS